VGPGEVSGFNRTYDLLSGEGQIAALIRNTSPARFPHLGPHLADSYAVLARTLATTPTAARAGQNHGAN
jgi:hypothetical protein